MPHVGKVPTSSKPWPNFFLVGTVKGGTTSLYQHLKQHPQVFLPEFKEPHYFARLRPSPERARLLEYLTEEERYLALYRQATDYLVIGDASTSYLWSPEAPSGIHDKVPDAKIIMLLRDPIQRAQSHYLMDYREGLINEPFTVEMLQRDYERSDKGFGVSYLYVDLGLYYEQVKRYLETFGPDRVLILQFEDMVRDTDAALARVARFLDLDPAPFTAMDLEQVHNGFKAPRGEWARRCAAHPLARWIGYRLLPRDLQWWLYQHIILCPAKKPTIADSVRDYLASLYDPDIRHLESLVDQTLPTLRRSW